MRPKRIIPPRPYDSKARPQRDATLFRRTRFDSDPGPPIPTDEPLFQTLTLSRLFKKKNKNGSRTPRFSAPNWRPFGKFCQLLAGFAMIWHDLPREFSAIPCTILTNSFVYSKHFSGTPENKLMALKINFLGQLQTVTTCQTRKEKIGQSRRSRRRYHLLSPTYLLRDSHWSLNLPFPPVLPSLAIASSATPCRTIRVYGRVTKKSSLSLVGLSGPAVRPNGDTTERRCELAQGIRIR